MIAIDTNILVRTVIEDDPDQSAAARNLMASGAVWIALTVLLESEWVFRSRYGLDRAAIIRIFQSLLGQPTTHVQEPQAVAQALVWAGEGMQLADALHLASATGCTSFASFDRSLAEIARRLGAPAVSPP